jgi:hypothetical protein
MNGEVKSSVHRFFLLGKCSRFEKGRFRRLVSRGGAEDAEGWLRHLILSHGAKEQRRMGFPAGIGHFQLCCWRMEPQSH